MIWTEGRTINILVETFFKENNEHIFQLSNVQKEVF